MAKDEPISSYEEIEALIGRDSAVRLCNKFGGKVLYLPTVSGYEHHQLKQVVVKAITEQKLSIPDIALWQNLSAATVIDLVESGISIPLSRSTS